MAWDKDKAIEVGKGVAGFLVLLTGAKVAMDMGELNILPSRTYGGSFRPGPPSVRDYRPGRYGYMPSRDSGGRFLPGSSAAPGVGHRRSR